MSKAFLRESDSPALPELPPLVSPLPPGAKNYLTPDGADRLRSEVARLVDAERPKLVAARAEDEDAKQRLQVLDQRLRYLQESLRSAVMVTAPKDEPDIVRFGATVLVRDGHGETRYRIVGVDETDTERGWVSWLSPLARALMNARPGQRVVLNAPSGRKELEVIAVDYHPRDAGRRALSLSAQGRGTGFTRPNRPLAKR